MKTKNRPQHATFCSVHLEMACDCAHYYKALPIDREKELYSRIEELRSEIEELRNVVVDLKSDIAVYEAIRYEN